MTNALIWLVEKLLTRKLSATQRNRLVVHILDLEGALPVHATINSSDEGILINGQPLDIEKAMQLRDAATRILENRAYKLCADQVRFVAVKNGLATGLPPEDLLFFRAALWYGQELDRQLSLLAQRDAVTVRELT